MIDNQSTRMAYVAGYFYPDSQKELNQKLDEYLSTSEWTDLHLTPNEQIKALVVPHAGYIYSGAVAGTGYATLIKNYKCDPKTTNCFSKIFTQNNLIPNPTFKKVFILGSNHNEKAGHFKFSVFEEDYYQTPLGKVKISDISRELVQKYPKLFTYEKNANQSHIIEVQLPFLQRSLKNFELISIITGASQPKDLLALAEILKNYLDDQTLLIITSDLSHYHPAELAKELDSNCVYAITQLDQEKLVKCEACGLPALFVLLELAREKGWEAKLVNYKNSGDTAGDKKAVVGYSAIVFYGAKQNQQTTDTDPDQQMTDNDKQFLLNLARQTLSAAVNNNTPYILEKIAANLDPTRLSPYLKTKAATFVTLTKNKNLRGCIGDLIAIQPIYKSVIANTISAALDDTRFSAVQPEELKDIEIEISILTKPEHLTYRTTAELLTALEVGKTGVILQKGFHKATFLPQVWEQLPNKEDFLSHLCLKAGLDKDEWRSGNLVVQTYQVVSIE
ncbi:MAG: AmmeMemoRadiSam system protein B [Deltaproteobacteria bacterium]|nr:AmmeMemoRadiSam system protein B [Deltaproteobacteria bacterium]